MSTTKKFFLKSSDDESFEVDESVVLQSVTLSNLLDTCPPKTNEIPITEVSGDILNLVVEYCNKHADVGSISETDLENWDKKFVLEIDQSTIFDLILATNYLNIPSLLDLTFQTIADKIAACKDGKEIRERFGIVNDFTEGEEEGIRQESPWAFQ